MNRIHCIATILSGLAASALVALTGITAAFAYPDPPPSGPAGLLPPPTPPGWNKHPALRTYSERT